MDWTTTNDLPTLFTNKRDRMTDSIDSQEIKRQQREDWARAAPSWQKYDESLRRAGEPVTRRLLELARVQRGHRVLDIASGTGEPGLPAAEAVGPAGFVLLTDQSSEMLAVARQKAEARKLQNVDFRVGDAEMLELEPESFDAALCRSALPLMPNPLRCLQVVHAALKPGGRIALSVTGSAQANPYFALPFRVLRKYATLPRREQGTPGPFDFADPERLRSVMVEARYGDIQIETLQHTAMEFESGWAYWDYTSGFSATAAILAQVPPDHHAQVAGEIAALAGGGDPDGKVQFQGESVLAVATR